MTLARSTRVARILADHPPVLDAAARARLEETLVETARRRSLPPARTRDALAALLGEVPPALDPPRKQRLEDALVVARSDRRARLVGARVAVGVLAVAALAGLALLGPEAGDGAGPRAVVSGDREVILTLAEGGRASSPLAVAAPRALETGPHGSALVAQGASTLALAPASRATLVAASPTLLALELARGAVRVEFHPAVRGEQRLVVDTPRARVEVVGTVFDVAVGPEGETAVSVTEGVVRVVEREGGASRLLRAGERVELAAPRVASVAAPEAGPSASLAPSLSEPGASAAAPARLGAVARFAEAERLFDRERFAEARAVLRPLTDAPSATAARALTLTAEAHAREGALREAAVAYAAAARRGEGTTHGANALFALARLEERQLGDAAAARRAYAAYLDALPGGPLAEQARRALCRLGEASRCE